MKQIDTFHMLADETRLRALALIQTKGELCVCELVAGLDLPQPKISRHLTALREAGLLSSDRKAQWVFYQINPAMKDWQKQALAAAISSLGDEPVIKHDTERLAAMKNRPIINSAA